MAKNPINWIEDMPELLQEWNYKKNNIRPEQISIWSKEKVWWKCHKGHEWLSSMNNRQKKVGCPYCSGKLPIEGETDLATTNPEMLKEWDYKRNTIKPTELKAGSGAKVWWICSLNHTWQASPNHRKKGRGCPICSGKKVLPGYNDLESIRPEIASEWDYDLNGEMTPKEYTVRSGQKVWWKCSNNHSWEAVIASRTSEKYVGCPYCSGLLPIVGVTDLVTTNPELLEEWNYDKNIEVTPLMVKAGSSNKVWWKCKNGHEWEAVISSRTINKKGCPYCSGRFAIEGENDLVSIGSSLINEWNYDRNRGIQPCEIKEHSSKKVWWKCEKGHEWKAAVTDRSRGDGCPYCSGKRLLIGFNDLVYVYPNIAKEWNYEKNKGKRPEEYTSKAGIKVWWKCEKGHEWKALISNRSRGDGCPQCNSGIRTSFPEQAIYYYLKRTYPDAINRYIGKLSNKKELDIFIPSLKIAIEYDGSVWHDSEKALDKEVKKYCECKQNGIFLIRIKEEKGKVKDGSCDALIRMDSNFNNESYLELFRELSSYLCVSDDIDIERDRINIQENYRTEMKNNSLGAKYPNLVAEWDVKKNGMLTPYMFTEHSGERMWWICNKKHSWQAAISLRTKESGCPFCSGRYAIKGVNDLATLEPQIAEEWNYEKNGELQPYDLKRQSNKKVWWKCRYGHEWQAIVSNRTNRGERCPICNKN